MRMTDRDAGLPCRVIPFERPARREEQLTISSIAAVIAVIITHHLFDLDLLQISKNHRGELNMLLSEAIATFGLV